MWRIGYCRDAVSHGIVVDSRCSSSPRDTVRGLCQPWGAPHLTMIARNGLSAHVEAQGSLAQEHSTSGIVVE